MNTPYQRLRELLESQQAEFHELRHEPVFTSGEAARVRGAALASGAKALVCKADGRFLHIVLPAHMKLDSRGVRKRHGFRSLRFAKAEEVWELTGLKPGSIPPFGSLFGLPTWCDQRLAEQPEINFNAGDHAISIRMPYAEFIRIEQPELGLFGVEEPSG